MRHKLFILAILFLALLVSSETSQAQGGYELSWWTIDGGISTSTGGNYSLTGVTGQPEAGPTMRDSEGQYILTGGFVGVAPSGTGDGGTTYLPLIIKEN
jgi:hypothetical protein